jgi:hypothetical protein
VIVIGGVPIALHRCLAKDLRVALVTWRGLASALLNVTAVEESSEARFW